MCIVAIKNLSHYAHIMCYILILFFLASPYGKTKRVRWTEREKEAVLEAFAKHMENLILPSLREIQEMKKKYTLLAHRTSPQIKTWLHNKQKTLKRTCKYFIYIHIDLFV